MRYWLCKKSPFICSLYISLIFSSLSHSFFLSYNLAMPPFSLSQLTKKRKKVRRRSRNRIDFKGLRCAVCGGNWTQQMIYDHFVSLGNRFILKRFDLKELFINIERGASTYTAHTRHLGEMLECETKQFHAHRESNNKKKQNKQSYIKFSFHFSLKSKRNEMKSQNNSRAHASRRIRNACINSHIWECVQLSPDQKKTEERIQNNVTHTWKMNASTLPDYELYKNTHTKRRFEYYILNRTSYPIRLRDVMWYVMVSDVILLLLFGPVVSPLAVFSYARWFVWFVFCGGRSKNQPSLIYA